MRNHVFPVHNVIRARWMAGLCICMFFMTLLDMRNGLLSTRQLATMALPTSYPHLGLQFDAARAAWLTLRIEGEDR